VPAGVGCVSIDELPVALDHLQQTPIGAPASSQTSASVDFGELAVLLSRQPPQLVADGYLSSSEPPPRPCPLTGQRPWTHVHASHVERMANELGGRRLPKVRTRRCERGT
jgi:hypothetical protein